MPANSPGLARRKIPGAVGPGGGRTNTWFLAAIAGPIRGFRSGDVQPMTANHRFGFNTRAISVEALGTSGRNIKQKRLMTASKDAVSNGKVVASPVRNVTFKRPSRFAFR